MRLLDYIESTGTQYIDTGVIGSSSITAEIVFQRHGTYSSWGHIIGATTSDTDVNMIFGIHEWYEFLLKRGRGDIMTARYTFSEGSTYTVNFNSSALVINGNTVKTFSSQTFTTNLSLYLFCTNWGGSPNALLPSCRLYSCKIWDNGTLIRDFVPAAENNRAGLYDRVNDQFYSNAGTGEFLYPVWYIEGDNYPTTDYFPELPENAVNPPFPAMMWRIQSGVNNGYPFHALLPNTHGVDIWALHRKSQIHVYDLHEPQEGFTSNGLAILEPTSCTSWHDDDRWDVELVHPLDEWGKWKYLLPENILKIRGQLFRIDKYQPKISGSERTISIHATHISTDMVAQMIRQATFSGGDASDFIDFAFSSVDEPFFSEGLEPYTFEGYSDITTNAGETELVNCSLWAAIVGADNCLINRYGGELYRDNFYFSVCSRMQYAKDNAFRLRYTLDMTEISQTIDYSDFCTELYARDNFGNLYGVCWGGIEWAVHHPRQMAVTFNYSDFETAFDNLVHDAETLFFASDYPKVTYELTLANLKNDPRYAEFMCLQDYHYGDSGSIYCPELDIDTVQRITAEQRDELTGDVLRMTLGNLKNSWVRPSLMAGTVSSGSSVFDKQQQAMQEELKDAKLKALPDWQSARTYTWEEIRQFTWKETKNHGN